MLVQSNLQILAICSLGQYKPKEERVTKNTHGEHNGANLCPKMMKYQQGHPQSSLLE